MCTCISESRSKTYISLFCVTRCACRRQLLCTEGQRRLLLPREDPQVFSTSGVHVPSQRESPSEALTVQPFLLPPYLVPPSVVLFFWTASGKASKSVRVWMKLGAVESIMTTLRFGWLSLAINSLSSALCCIHSCRFANVWDCLAVRGVPSCRNPLFLFSATIFHLSPGSTDWCGRSKNRRRFSTSWTPSASSSYSGQRIWNLRLSNQTLWLRSWLASPGDHSVLRHLNQCVCYSVRIPIPQAAEMMEREYRNQTLHGRVSLVSGETVWLHPIEKKVHHKGLFLTLKNIPLLINPLLTADN